MAKRHWLDRIADWWLARPSPEETERWRALIRAHTAEGPPLVDRATIPTLTELADLLEELTAEGMPPRLQARHAAFHWPGIVREEEEKP